MVNQHVPRIRIKVKTFMAVTGIVSMPVADIHEKYNFVVKVAKPLKIFSRGKSLINPKELSAVGVMADIRGKLSRYRSF